MGNNPSDTTLTRPRTGIEFCLARKERDGQTLICTRVNNHTGHCCDEIAGESWTDRGAPFDCKDGHDHGAEKGLS